LPTLEDIVTKDSSPVKIKTVKKAFLDLFSQETASNHTPLLSAAQLQPDASKTKMMLIARPGLQLENQSMQPPRQDSIKNNKKNSIYHFRKVGTQKARVWPKFFQKKLGNRLLERALKQCLHKKPKNSFYLQKNV